MPLTHTHPPELVLVLLWHLVVEIIYRQTESPVHLFKWHALYFRSESAGAGLACLNSPTIYTNRYRIACMEYYPCPSTPTHRQPSPPPKTRCDGIHFHYLPHLHYHLCTLSFPWFYSICSLRPVQLFDYSHSSSHRSNYIRSSTVATSSSVSSVMLHQDGRGRIGLCCGWVRWLRVYSRGVGGGKSEYWGCDILTWKGWEVGGVGWADCGILVQHWFSLWDRGRHW